MTLDEQYAKQNNLEQWVLEHDNGFTQTALLVVEPDLDWYALMTNGVLECISPSRSDLISNLNESHIQIKKIIVS